MTTDDKKKGPRPLPERIAEIDAKLVELQRERLRLEHMLVAEQADEVPHTRYLARLIRANWRGGYGDLAMEPVAKARELLASYHRTAHGPSTDDEVDHADSGGNPLHNGDDGT